MVSRAERRWVFWLGLGCMLVTSLPYLAGYFVQTPQWHYSGLALAEEDGYSYLAKMLSGANGAWLFETPYTLAPQSGFLGFLPYLMLGKLTSPPGQYEQLVALFHLFRMAGGVLVCLATYDFVSLFVSGVRWRKVATLIAMVGGGWGALSLLGLEGLWRGPMALEFYSPETFGFLGLLAVPHLAWARALLLWGLIAYLTAENRRGLALAGGAWLLMGLFQPLVVVVGWAVLGAHVLALFVRAWRMQAAGWAEPLGWLKRAVPLGVISAPIVVYNVVAFRVDPFLNLWQKQNYLPSPPLGDYLLAYGILLPLAALGLVYLWKALDARKILLPAWLCAFPLLAYLPYNLQRRLPEGLWVALAALAALGLSRLSASWRRAAAVWLGIGFLPAILLVTIAFQSATGLGQPSFLPTGEVKAFAFLAGQAQGKPAVLAAYDTSTVLPAYAGVRVPMGHGPESLGLAELRPRVEGFFSTDFSDVDRRALLAELGIDYVFYGPAERRLGNVDLEAVGSLEPVYRDGDYLIYRVESSLDP